MTKDQKAVKPPGTGTAAFRLVQISFQGRSLWKRVTLSRNAVGVTYVTRKPALEGAWNPCFIRTLATICTEYAASVQILGTLESDKLNHGKSKRSGFQGRHFYWQPVFLKQSIFRQM